MPSAKWFMWMLARAGLYAAGPELDGKAERRTGENQMKWIMLPEGHNWLKHPEVGAIANIDEDGSMHWHSRDGHHWEGAKSAIETWLEYGFVECTKEQAEASIANFELDRKTERRAGENQ